MGISAIGGHLVFGTTYGASTRSVTSTGSATVSRPRDNESLQQFGLFLNNLHGLLQNAQESIGSAGHSKRFGAIKLTSATSLGLSATARAAILRSSGAIGGAPNGFTSGAQVWNTAARAQPTLGGSYDGSNGDQTLTLRATQGGLVGRDDLVFDVLDGFGAQVQQLNVAGDYSAGSDITLDNGLTMQLSAGVVNVGAEMSIAVAYSSTSPSSSYSPGDPAWTLKPRPTTTVGGTYDGSNGSQRLTLRTTSGGTLGVDDVTFDVLDQDGAVLQQITVASAYTPGEDITLANGLTLALSAGTLGTGDAFAVDVNYSAGTPQRSFSPGQPAWAGSSSTQATVGGSYDGSNGTQTLTFRVSSEGDIGSGPITLDVLDAQGELLQQIEVAADYAAGSEITLANGLTLSLGEGTAVAGDEFTVDVSEVAGTPETSYAPVAPDWTTAARSGATVGGTYDGANGTQKLTLRVTGGGTVGSNELRLDVLGEDGSVVDQLTVAADYAAGDPIALANGLTLSLGAGALGVGDEFSLDVAYDAGSTSSSATPDTSAWDTSAVPTASLGGAYDGSNGSQALTLRVAQGGVIGTDQVLIDVLDEQGSVLEQLTVANDYAPGANIALANGVTLSLSAGRVVEGDAFSVDVSTSVPVDQEAAFDGGGGGAPAYLLGAAITDGAFELNGASIDVYASDSLTTVIDRINAADAGVTARFDTDTSRIVLTQATAGSDGDIQVANDSSGFLAAMGLDDATLQAGGDGDFASALDQVSAMSGVDSGTLVINGTSIALDVSRDSIADMIAKFAAAGVTLSWRDDLQRFELRGKGTMTLEDGDTGFLAKLGLEAGEYAGGLDARGFANPDKVSNRLHAVVAAWNQASETTFEGTAATQSGRLDTTLATALRNYFTAAGMASDGSTLRTSFGLNFEFGNDGKMKISINQESLEAAMRTGSRDIQAFLAGTGDKAGLLTLLETTTHSTGVAVNAILGVRGLSALDVYA